MVLDMEAFDCNEIGRYGRYTPAVMLTSTVDKAGKAPFPDPAKSTNQTGKTSGLLQKKATPHFNPTWGQSDI